MNRYLGTYVDTYLSALYSSAITEERAVIKDKLIEEATLPSSDRGIQEYGGTARGIGITPPRE